MSDLILSVDQGTTSSRAILFDGEGKAITSAQVELPQIFPKEGWVEHNPAQIWQDTQTVIQGVLAQSASHLDGLGCIGVTNQRETTIIWERATGRPVGNAIVWQDRRTAEDCRRLLAAGHETAIREKTGLLLDPYFSGTKLAWLLNQDTDLRRRAGRGEVAFGTVDSWLLYNLTGGQVHATDATNAARTLLYNIHDGQWDPELLAILDIPVEMLPEVKDSAGIFGETDRKLYGRAVPISGIAGDQQAATVGQACFAPGMIKSTYGTGCFMLMNTGLQAVTSNNRLLTTIAYQLNGSTTYALEGSIFVAGATMQWLRDGLGLLDDAAASEALAQSVPSSNGVYLVPGFTGLGAPHWDAEARGAVYGLTRDTNRAHMVRAGLEAVAYQTRDLMQAMQDDAQQAGMDLAAHTLRVDGGMVANSWLMQYLADILNLPVDRPTVAETTALGAAYLAGVGSGLYSDLSAVTSHWQHERRFSPDMADADREAAYEGWQAAITRTLSSG